MLDLKACEKWCNKFVNFFIAQVAFKKFIGVSLSVSYLVLDANASRIPIQNMQTYQRLIETRRYPKQTRNFPAHHNTHHGHLMTKPNKYWEPTADTDYHREALKDYLPVRGRQQNAIDRFCLLGIAMYHTLYMYAWVDLSKWFIGDLVMWFHSMLCRPLHVGTGYIVPTLAVTTRSSMWTCDPGAGFVLDVNILDTMRVR